MSVRRAAPGPQVATGRLRVDAARAIAKLREYQLADRAAWILEAIRAAVASGATGITLAGDANDIWLSWQGPAWDPASLPRLFDELVSPEPAEELQHVRLLAAAVNSALGMKPAYVDVFSVAGETASRVRYTPDVLAEPEDELGEAKLRELEVESVPPPEGVVGGMHVHLRRRVSLEVLGYLLGEPPELPLVRDRCRDIAIPLQLGALVLHRATTSDVVRIPLAEGLDGFIAVTHPERSTWKVQLEVAERGVVLVRYPLELFDFEPRAPVPVRLFVDADRLPTNASRSQVRRDVHPISSAERRGRQLVAALVAELAKIASVDHPVARHASLLLLASNIAGHPAGWRSFAPELKPLATLPLLHSATGKTGALTTSWLDPVHTGGRPLEADLEPWLGDVVWLAPDDKARVLLGGFPVDKYTLRLHARFARKQRRAQRKFLAHATRDLRVETQIVPRVRAPLGVSVPGSCVPDLLFNNVRGEVCIYPSGRDATLIVLLDGRQLERLELESPIPFDAVIESPLVQPADRYRGVARDHVFDHLTRAMRAGVVRALEALAARVDHVELREGTDRAFDRYLFRKALAIAADLHCKQTGPLLDAPGWLSVTGIERSLAQLLAEQTIGTVAENAALVPPAKRVVVFADAIEARELAALVGKPLVDYQPAAGTVQRVSSARLAAQLPRSDGAACLYIREDDLVAAITLATASTIQLCHMGRRISEITYPDTYVRCSIAVDSDDIVPDVGWKRVIGDVGLGARSYAAWELALLRAIARALIGERVPELEVSAPITLEDTNGRALAKVLSVQDPTLVLGVALLERVVTAPLFRLLGVAELRSARDVAAGFRNAIPYLDSTVEEDVDDFHPLLGGEAIARLLGSLVQRPIVDARGELERRNRQMVFALHYTRHLETPEEPIALPAGVIAAPVPASLCKGLVGISDGRFEVRVFVEKRPFRTYVLRHFYPLQAAIELPASACNDTFTDIPQNMQLAIADRIIECVPALIAALVAHDPLSLDSPPVRAVLNHWLVRGKVTNELKELLRTTPAFRSIQGKRVSIAEASGPRLIVQVASWTDPWLSHGDREPMTAYDEPVLLVSDKSDALYTILDAVHTYGVSEVTAEVARLQARRRMERGLVPTPRVIGVAAELKRDLRSFGEIAARLGHGEIGLVASSTSNVLIHEAGQLKREVEIVATPAVQLAIEDPTGELSWEDVQRATQTLALQLVEEVIRVGTPLPHAIRSNLAVALFTIRIPPSVLGRQPLFLCTDGDWAAWPDVIEQRAKKGDVWAVTAMPAAGVRPLDDERLVLVLEPDVLELGARLGHGIVDASHELELDRQARENMERPAVAALDLPARDGILVEGELEDTERVGIRGLLAVLDPAEAAQRGTYVYKDMKLLGRIDDVCRWPTIAVVDDARIVPNRTWSGPKPDETWQSIAKHLRAASERALAELGEIPADQLGSLRINGQICSEVAAVRESRALVRGALWLQDVPNADVAITVHYATGVRSFVPSHGLALGGWLAVVQPEPSSLDKILEELCAHCHGKLVRALQRRPDTDRDVIAAHLAHALALNTVKPAEVSGLTFDCFAPSPLSARALWTLLRSGDNVAIARAPDGEGFVDDGSELAKVVRRHLVGRLVASTAPASPPATAVSTRRPARTTKEEAIPAHPLRGLVAALSERLGKLGIGAYDWVIDDVVEPIVAYQSRQIAIAGDNPLLRRLAAELLSKSILAGPAIDAVTAHIVSLLNIALADVTDTVEQHAIDVLLTSPRSGGRPRSHRSS